MAFNGKCEACSEGCLKCQSASTCTQCDDSKKLCLEEKTGLCKNCALSVTLDLKAIVADSLPAKVSFGAFFTTKETEYDMKMIFDAVTTTKQLVPVFKKLNSLAIENTETKV